MISWPKEIWSVKRTNKQASSVQVAFKESGVVTQGTSHPRDAFIAGNKKEF